MRLSDLKRKTLGEKVIDCIFVGYAEHSKAYRFYVIEPNDSVSINSIIESRNAIFDENRFSSIPRPKDMLNLKGMIILMMYQKEAIFDEIGSIMENNTWVISDLPQGCKPLGCKWTFKRKMKVDGTIDKFKARLVIQGFRQKEGIDYFDNYAPVACITTIRLLLALAAIHNLVIHQMDVKTTFLNADLNKDVYMKQTEGFVMSGYSDASWISHVKDSSSMSGWVFLLGGGAISWASKKQTCITGSTIESEFVALATAGKEEWLRNLIHEIPIWLKPIASIFIHCDSAATLAKAYN
uniref:Zinc finger, CCHC-type n=1 Tax=Tanacetum cinerariifolium TaxID=118510 RepID=A0A6L2K3U8_TANCI|nr:zinc finger, CCHC-type [Tanacetum cinerariifolium]